MDDPSTEWNETYLTDESPPWEIGRPQPAVVDLAAGGDIAGRVLDVGCGTGETALHFARQGHPVTGVDLSERAIELARRKATDDLPVQFFATDLFAFEPAQPFDSVVDSLVFHTFDPETRARYAAWLHRLVAPDGRVHVLAFSDRADSDIGPATLSRDDFTDVFADGWDVRTLREVSIESRADSGLGPIPGTLVTVVPA